MFSVLYRKKDYFGLNLKRLTDLYKLLQVTKVYTLKNSEDQKVREAYKSREAIFLELNLQFYKEWQGHILGYLLEH